MTGAKKTGPADEGAAGAKAKATQSQLSLGAAFASPNSTQELDEVATQSVVKLSHRNTVARRGGFDVPADRPAVGAKPLAEDGLDDVSLDPVTTDRSREPKVFSVGELIRSARVMLETRYADVKVQGELSGVKPSGPGHLYFTLKEAQAQVDCVMFSREATRLTFRPADGMQIMCRGRLTIYEGRGKFQMTVVQMEPTGAGALSLAFEQLKQRLAAEGLFLQSRKRPLPLLPSCVGVVTSSTGAVIRDIVHVAHRRFPMRLLLSPTPVQGEGAAARIVEAMERLWRVPGVDVIILARGGGSLEDLWPFNEEVVARAIARSPVPVISAVGHETDFTIADFVADCRAPTPSAAAEIAIPELRSLKEELQSATRRLQRGTHRELQSARLVLERLTARISDPRRLLDRQRQALDDLQMRAGTALVTAMASRQAQLIAMETGLLRAHPQKRISEQRASVLLLERRLTNGLSSSLGSRKQLLARFQTKLEALSPLRVLDRGYSLVRTIDGRLVTQARDVQPGQRVQVTLRQGSVTASVDEVREPRQDNKDGTPS